MSQPPPMGRDEEVSAAPSVGLRWDDVEIEEGVF